MFPLEGLITRDSTNLASQIRQMVFISLIDENKAARSWASLPYLVYQLHNVSPSIDTEDPGSCLCCVAQWNNANYIVSHAIFGVDWNTPPPSLP